MMSRVTFSRSTHQQNIPSTLRNSCKRNFAKYQKIFCSGVTEEDYRSKNREDIRVAVFGATGYIGRFVVKELQNRGYKVVAFSREKSGIGGKKVKQDVEKDFPGVDVVFGDVTDPESIQKNAFKEPVDVVVSCLASRTGGKKDSWLVDYLATKNSLDAAVGSGASHFVLLSAICVQRPLLEFQKAKLKFEEDLQSTKGITYSIVRPTAFFKSLAGQVDIVKGGSPYVYFGDGTLAACKPISESDLAAFIADCVDQPDKINQVLPIGGPGPAYNAKQQAEMLFNILEKKPKCLGVPVAIMDGAISLFEFLAKIFPGLEDSEEFARIGKYYATESMLVWDAEQQKYDADKTPSYGEQTLESFFNKAVKEGLQGQELGDQAVFGMK